MRMQIGIFEVEIRADTEADTEAVTEAGIGEEAVAEVEVLVDEEEVPHGDGSMVSSKAKEVSEGIINT